MPSPSEGIGILWGLVSVQLQKARSPLGKAQPRLHLMNPLRGDFFCGEIFPPGKGCIPLPRVPSWVFVSEEGRDAPFFRWVMVGVLAKLPKSQ